MGEIMIVNGWESDIIKKPIYKYRDGSEKFEIDNVACFNTIKNPDLIWAYYGACTQETNMQHYLDRCIKGSGQPFDLPMSSELDIDGFHNKTGMTPFTVKEVWCKDVKRVGVPQSMFFILRR